MGMQSARASKTAEDDAKKPYEAPRLTVHGTVQDLTGAAGGTDTKDITLGSP